MTDGKRHSIKGDPAHVAAEQERNARWAATADKLGHQMTDIQGLIERLREAVSSPWCSHGTRMLEAADALSRLSEDKKRLEEALESVSLSGAILLQNARSCCAQHMDISWSDADEPGWYRDCRVSIEAARSALRGE
jgi:hypothetical protein